MRLEPRITPRGDAEAFNTGFEIGADMNITVVGGGGGPALDDDMVKIDQDRNVGVVAYTPDEVDVLIERLEEVRDRARE